MDIILSSQNEPIKMVDDHGFDTGETTTEGIVYQTGQPIKIRLKYPQFTSDTEKGVVGNTTDMEIGRAHV